MKKIILLILTIFGSAQIQAQNNEMWHKVSSTTRLSNYDRDEAVYKLDEAFLKKKLSKKLLKTDKKNMIEITIPNMDGDFEKYTVWESSNFEPELQTKYPDIRAYEGVSKKDKTSRIHFSVSPDGIQTMVLRTNEASEFIEPVATHSGEYVLFTAKSRDKENLRLTCITKDEALNQTKKNNTSRLVANNTGFKTFRLALSCTGEYAAYFGGTKAKALAAMNATMTRVNGVYNRDLAVKLILIANNDAVIYTDATTDPYSNAVIGVGGRDVEGAWNKELQKTLTKIIGEKAYDIGHLFGATGGGGNAGCIGCVCDSLKGSAFTSPADGRPERDTFDIDFVAHEMGHQLGANHTFSFGIEGTGVSVEPGSASTIMGYAGITGNYDIQEHSDDYFSFASIIQIERNLDDKLCSVNQDITNNPPVANAGNNYTIPYKTPFVLKAVDSETNNNAVTYCWEQNDSATTTSGFESFAKPNKPDGPLFRSVQPSSSPIRYMPDLKIVLSGNLRSTWESAPSITRTLHFTLTARDNAASGIAQTVTDQMFVNVRDDVGPFMITSQNTDNVSWLHGTNQMITWEVKNTNTLGGSANVNIKLSTDGGLTFPIVLVANTPNDGSQNITVPKNVNSTNCRILIEPTGNIFYAVNSKVFAIGYSVESSCHSYPINEEFAIPNVPEYISRTINVPADLGLVSDVNVSVGLSHSKNFNAEVKLVNPQGKEVRLFYRNCLDASGNLLLKYDDLGEALNCSKTTLQTVTPIELLSVFNNQDSQGIWTLKARNPYKIGSGILNSASIEICTKKYTLQPEVVEIKESAVYYVNPNKGNFDVSFKSESTTGVRIFIYNALGKEVYFNSFESMENFKAHIQLKNYVAAGIYFMTIYDGDKKMVKKVIFE